MSTLTTLLSDPESPKLPITAKPIEKPTPASSKANTLAAQEQAIAAASVGSSVFRSAATYLAINAEFKRMPLVLCSDRKVKVAVA